MKQYTYEAKAPSNIALIKYMGKTDAMVNAATNASISYTLPHLLTTVTVQAQEASEVVWKALDGNFQLSEQGQKKFLAHWSRCQQRLAPKYSGGVVIASGNNFPSDCGLASSASSFAALTEAAYGLFGSMKLLERDWSREELARLSREGSGSSCRSFFSPWAYWCGETVRPLDSVWSQLLHSVIIVDGEKKKVSSSEAHRRVTTSSLFVGRIDRAENRSQTLQKLLLEPDSWAALFELAWSEFWDMHVLFETSSPPFYYMTAKSLMALRYLQESWSLKGDGPLITMDAGPNIHLLYRQDQQELQRSQSLDLHKLDLAVLTSHDL